MKNEIKIINKLIILLSAFLTVILSISCNKVAQKTVLESLLAACGDYHVFLSAWWNRVEGQTPSNDPMGGYIFLYWVDEDGNACHGDPGVSGQPGPYVINAFHQEAYSTAENNNIITQEQLEDYQEIPFNIVDYPAGGFHFVQYANTIWRFRDDGDTYMVKSNLVFSVPDVVSLDYEFCLAPVFAYGSSECASTMVLAIPRDPSSSQHPDLCQERSMPVAISMSNAELLDNCVLILPHGLEITTQ
ncbi:MAG: hypothetical protein H8E14_18260 [Candidatus Marinimicrobia bacterium]|nr:hypothetical protein [Candidatus Neomarinimicrobiota bacterium]